MVKLHDPTVISFDSISVCDRQTRRLCQSCARALLSVTKINKKTCNPSFIKKNQINQLSNFMYVRNGNHEGMV